MSQARTTPEQISQDRDWRVTRLGDELDKLLKLITWARECLDNELMEGMGYKKLGISDKDLRKIKDLAATMNSAVEAKIRFDKAQKSLAESMTPEEEYKAVVSYLKSLPQDKKQNILQHVRHPSTIGRNVGGSDGDSDSQES